MNSFNNKTKVLLIGGLFFLCHLSHSTTVLKDTFIYRVNDEVFSISDIEHIKQELYVLACLYPDSILVRTFPLHSFKKNKKKSELFKHAILLSKLNQYVESHSVHLSRKLKKAFYLATRKECNSINIFESTNSFSDSFRKILSSEVFLRKRFLGEKQGVNTTKSIDKAMASIRSLLIVIDKQVESETYWK